MKVKGNQRANLKHLTLVAAVAFALEFVGCKGGTGGATTTEPASGTAGDTNSAATNANMSADTNTSATSTSQ